MKSDLTDKSIDKIFADAEKRAKKVHKGQKILNLPEVPKELSDFEFLKEDKK